MLFSYTNTPLQIHQPAFEIEMKVKTDPSFTAYLTNSGSTQIVENYFPTLYPYTD